MAVAKKLSVSWYDERLGEFPEWSQYTKNTFIDFEQEDEEEERRASLRRERSAPASVAALRQARSVQESYGLDITSATQVTPQYEPLRMHHLQILARSSRGRRSSRGAGRVFSRCSSRSSRRSSSAWSSGRSSRAASTCASRRVLHPTRALGVASKAPRSNGSGSKERRANEKESKKTDAAHEEVSLDSVKPRRGSRCHTQPEMAMKNRFAALEGDEGESGGMAREEPQDVTMHGAENHASGSNKKPRPCPPKQLARNSKKKLTSKPARSKHASDVAALEDDVGDDQELAELADAQSSCVGSVADSDPAVDRSMSAVETCCKTYSAQAGHIETAAAVEDGSVTAKAEDSSDRKLTQEQAHVVATLAVRGNELLVARQLQSASSRRILLAVFVDPAPAGLEALPDTLPGDLGTVLLCEACDSSGWCFGTVVAPASLAGRSGCFHRQGAALVAVEPGVCGRALQILPGSWQELEHAKPLPTKQQQLRRKAALNRLRAVKSAWEKASACTA
eukprot:TRINITY_DN30819_c0_g1_i1.p1 TRINITY_DN30819_c0_g1~~TRINITY_DN30819_c0_g1_i1.p1  ORF type:complete len:534 (-),score=98.42 TRINITY_DN30819_c0_g1_i1:527-2050(-)